MFKTFLLLLLAFGMMLEPTPAAATPAPETTAASATVGTELLTPDLFRRKPRKGRPNYMRYRGNSRQKHHKLGPVRRYKLRRKAQAKKNRPRGSVEVGAPTRTMQK